VRRLGLALVVAAALAPAAAAATRPFAAQANAICRAATAKFEKLPAPKSPKLPALAGYLDSFVGILRPTQARLEALQAPAGQRLAFARYLAVTRREIALIAQMASAARRNDRPAYLRLSDDVDRLDERGNAAARRAGLAVCGRSR
jgi:hypothetical protein